MKRLPLVFAAVATAALTFAAPAQLASADLLLAPLTVSPLASASASAGCSGRTPTTLRLARLHGPHVRLSWHAPRGTPAPSGYRILRSGRTVGQTTRTSMVLAVVLGRHTTFTVQARYAQRPQVCAAHLQSRLALRPPGRVAGLRVLASSSTGVRIGWRSAKPGDAPIAGYRVLRDGAVVAQTHARNFTLKLSGARSHRVAIAAVDTRGHVGQLSRALTIAGPGASAGSVPPGVPGALSVSEVSEAGATVWWTAAKAGSGRIIGYRLYRDGTLVGQTTQDSMRLTHLSPTHIYTIVVAAVDANHREGPRTPALSLTTSHVPPGGPALISALRVTDTSATLSWQAGSVNGARIVGYLLFQDGQPKRVVDGQATTVTLASNRKYTFTVRTLDSYGYLSTPAPNLTVVTTHTPPSTPANLSAGEVTASSAALSWSPSQPVSGTIVGYRVFRNEIPVGQTSSTGMTLASLAPSSAYKITVVAVDSLGAISAPTAPLSFETSDPTPTHGHVQAFLLASTDQSFDDLEAHYQQIGTVYPTYFDCGAGGAVTGNNDPLVTGWAEARQIAVMPRLNCQNSTDENQILNEPATRAHMIEQLAALCASNGYQGIQVDFEGAAPAEREPFTEFITALGERLHSQGDKLSTVVTAKYYNIMSGRAAMYNDAALSKASDYMFVLDWGLHWTTSAPGGMDELPWFQRVAEYTATLPEKSKYVLGMPMYGIDWPNGGGGANPGTPLEFNSIMALASLYGATPEWEPTAADPHFSYTDGNGVQHSVWYSDQQSIATRVALAESLGLGVGLWHLGSEDQSIWELPGLGG
ncbi:MAG TPA: fibronectin type III domain-containing protein [Solirubrobacteraceae bacterium]|jgi:spore germination protein YaaH